jgi:hypothetical protein
MSEELNQAKTIYDGLQSDIQIYLMEEYIEPQLRGDDLIKEFNILIESKECQSLDYSGLLDPVRKIIANPAALAQMCKLNPIRFKEVYEQHFIKKVNTFRRVSCPYTSMCMEFVMLKWH